MKTNDALELIASHIESAHKCLGNSKRLAQNMATARQLLINIPELARSLKTDIAECQPDNLNASRRFLASENPGKAS